jgi:hypothetical protein
MEPSLVTFARRAVSTTNYKWIAARNVRLVNTVGKTEQQPTDARFALLVNTRRKWSQLNATTVLVGILAGLRRAVRMTMGPSAKAANQASITTPENSNRASIVLPVSSAITWRRNSVRSVAEGSMEKMKEPTKNPNVNHAQTKRPPRPRGAPICWNASVWRGITTSARPTTMLQH